MQSKFDSRGDRGKTHAPVALRAPGDTAEDTGEHPWQGEEPAPVTLEDARRPAERVDEDEEGRDAERERVEVLDVDGDGEQVAHRVAEAGAGPRRVAGQGRQGRDDADQAEPEVAKDEEEDHPAPDGRPFAGRVLLHEHAGHHAGRWWRGEKKRGETGQPSVREGNGRERAAEGGLTADHGEDEDAKRDGVGERAELGRVLAELVGVDRKGRMDARPQAVGKAATAVGSAAERHQAEVVGGGRRRRRRRPGGAAVESGGGTTCWPTLLERAAVDDGELGEGRARARGGGRGASASKRTGEGSALV